MTAKIPWYEQGRDPDYRFSLANERTYLAWIRTALAVLAGALLVRQFITELQPRWLVVLIAVALSALAAVLGGAAYCRWRGNEYAMRVDSTLPRPSLVPLLSVALVVLGSVTVFLVLRM